MALAVALDKKRLWRDIDREERRKKREKLAELRAQLREARAHRKETIKNAKERCRSERLAVRERARALRIRGLAELREAARLERQSARDACAVGRREARKMGDVEHQRAELTAERQYQADMRRIERANKTRRREHPHATYIDRRSESDDEVRANIPADLVALFERVKRGIVATPRMTRTEMFLKYAEEHPDDVVDVIEDKTEALIRDLERREREVARRDTHATPRRGRQQMAEIAEAPF